MLLNEATPDATNTDRTLYPEARYPVGPWDYWLFYRERFGDAVRPFERDLPPTFAALYRPGSPKAVGKPAPTADVRPQGGWFGGDPLPPGDPSTTILTPDEFAALVDAFAATGIAGADAWYMNDASNVAFAGRVRDFGRRRCRRCSWTAPGIRSARITTTRADPMRADCTDLTEAMIAAGHMLMIEQPDAVNEAIETWLRNKQLFQQGAER